MSCFVFPNKRPKKKLSIVSSTSFFRQKNYKNNLPQKQKPITQNSAKSRIANLIVPYLVHIASTAIAIDKPANYILMSIVTIEVK